jgi:hypothetical protein
MKRESLMRRLASCLLSAAVLARVGVGVAAPYVPVRDEVVVATLRQPLTAGEGSAAERTLQRLKARWLSLSSADKPGPDAGPALAAAAPPAQGAMDASAARRLAAAASYARAAIDQARREGDPRWLGAAQAALAPWWAQSAPPPVVRLLRATILQSQHQFDAALLDLDALVPDTRTPLGMRAQARLTRASVLQVRGRWPEAAQDCQALADTIPVESAACLAELASLRGDTAQAHQALGQLGRQASPAQATWLALMRAELAERMGRVHEADGLYQQALQAGRDSYTLGAYADFLLDAARPAEVVALLGPYQQVDALLLRLALAWQAMGPAHAREAKQAVATLQARFDAAHVRGERVHLREEARFMLQLRQQPQAALPLALANWAVQKEPADVRILLQAARATGRQDVLARAAQWVHEHGLADARLVEPAATLAMPKETRPRRSAA